ncbi:hypothetical protein [Pseudothauera rhizosphaerae]|uniref:Uncharacterized protein n=1 Tax=Pseudothauera rhizosphaerae TaxID=2565932 RepID=A0A4S4B2C5_9RHOO|nr:hypothetical protein [Pseudothauera rhizosphaerae]THF65061.1 hypothetical protein E6O51_00185 [Pseudothauera rhizosphaerae]
MSVRFASLLFVLFAAFVPQAFAQEVISFHGCTDAKGQPVVSVADPAAPLVAGSGEDAGRPAIRYNPTLLPELPQAVRLFFFAHECARHNLGLPLTRTLSAEEAQRADCWGLDSLTRSGLLRGEAAVAALQADLRFTPEQWAVLPGPQRAFDLPACRARTGNRLRLDVAPTAEQDNWNTCVRVCGETLRACRGAACNKDYDSCVARCGGN